MTAIAHPKALSVKEHNIRCREVWKILGFEGQAAGIRPEPPTPKQLKKRKLKAEKRNKKLQKKADKLNRRKKKKHIMKKLKELRNAAK